MSRQKYYEKLLLVATVFIVFFVIMMIGLPFLKTWLPDEGNSREGLLIISSVQAFVLFIIPSFVCARFIQRNPFDYLRLNRPPGFLPILGVVFAYLISLPALNQIIYWNMSISFPEGMEQWGATLKDMEDRANEISQMMMNVTSVGGLLVNLAVIALLTAFGEELFFRGTLQHTAGSNGMHHTAIWVVALLFSALHFQIFGFIPRLLLGAWFGYIFYWSRSIYVPVIAHFLNNGVVVVCTWLTAHGSAFNFDMFGVTEYGFPVAAFVSALSTVVFLTYFRRFFFYRTSDNEESKELKPSF